jgi:hypothetical protein
MSKFDCSDTEMRERCIRQPLEAINKELLEALQDIVMLTDNMMRIYASDHARWLADSTPFAKAKAAIRKATGGAL